MRGRYRWVCSSNFLIKLITSSASVCTSYNNLCKNSMLMISIPFQEDNKVEHRGLLLKKELG